MDSLVTVDMSACTGLKSMPTTTMAYCPALRNVTFGPTLTAIPTNTFYGSGIVSITIPENITSIGQKAFYNCKSLTDITMHDGVTSLGSQCFQNATALLSITVPNGVTVIPVDCFNGCSSLQSVTMSDSVTSMAGYTFRNCTSLTSVTLSDNITSIGAFAFDSCKALTSIKLPSKLTSIGNNLFNACALLTTIEGGIPSGITSIPQNAFKGCTVLSDLGQLPSGLKYIGQDAFNSCKALTSVTLPDGLETIYNYAFTKCTALVSVNIPDSVTYLGVYAFNECYALTTVDISENSQIVGEMKNTFNGCSLLTSFIIPRGVTSIGDNTFRGCKALANIGGSLPSGVTLIGQDAFNNCILLTELVLPQGLVTIKSYAFATCTGLVSINIPDTVTSLGSYAFNNCSSLKTVTISESSQLQGNLTATFNKCTSLTSIYIPSGITSFGYDVFSYCSSLASVTIDEGLLEITASNNFRDCKALTSIKLPNTLTSVADNNFGGCTALSEVRLGDGLTHLGAGNLTLKALKRVYIPASLLSLGTHLLGYTNVNDSSLNITFIFTGSYAQAQALRDIARTDTANSANASKLYDAKLVSVKEYDVTSEPSGYHFVYDYSKCEAFYDSHTLSSYNSCVDKCQVCLHLYAVASPVHNFENGEAIVYEDFAQFGIKTIVCQNEGCKCNDGSSQSVNPIFTFYGYSIYEVGSSFCVNYTVDMDALEAYEATNGVALDFGFVGAYVGYLNGGAPLDPSTAKPVDVSATGKRIYYHSIRKMAEPNTHLRLVNIQKENYEEEFYLCLYIFDGSEVKYLTADYSTLMPDPVSYAEVRGPIETSVGGMSYSTEQETTPADDRIKQQNYSNSVYNTGSELSSSQLQGSGWFDKGILGKANTVITGGKILGYNNAAKFMQHYLDNTGTTYNLDVAAFLSQDSGALASRNNAINNALRAAELLAREGEILTVNQLSEGHPMQNSLAEEDWQYSLGSYFDDVDIINLRVEVVDGVKTYTADIKYIVTDYYNWDTNNKNAFAKIGPSPYELHELHKAGLAREFLTYGEITYSSVTWTEGQTVSDISALN